MGAMYRRNILYSRALPRRPARCWYHPGRAEAPVGRVSSSVGLCFRHGGEHKVQTVTFALCRRVCFFPGAWHAADALLSVRFLAPKEGKAVVPGAKNLGPHLQLGMCEVQIVRSVGDLIRCKMVHWCVLSSFSFSIMPRKDGVQRNERRQPSWNSW